MKTNVYGVVFVFFSFDKTCGFFLFFRSLLSPLDIYLPLIFCQWFYKINRRMLKDKTTPETGDTLLIMLEKFDEAEHLYQRLLKQVSHQISRKCLLMQKTANNKLH